MEELRKSFEALGFENVKTYINSGNVAFDAEMSNETSLVSKIEETIESAFGRPIQVMIRQQKEFEMILESNPFEGEFESHKEMHVLFLKDEMPREKQDQLLAAAAEPERFAVKGRQIYCHLPLGVADSLLGKGYIEKQLKVAVTARNWRTVKMLADL